MSRETKDDPKKHARAALALTLMRRGVQSAPNPRRSAVRAGKIGAIGMGLPTGGRALGAHWQMATMADSARRARVRFGRSPAFSCSRARQKRGMPAGR